MFLPSSRFVLLAGFADQAVLVVAGSLWVTPKKVQGQMFLIVSAVELPAADFVQQLVVELVADWLPGPVEPIDAPVARRYVLLEKSAAAVAGLGMAAASFAFVPVNHLVAVA